MHASDPFLRWFWVNYDEEDERGPRFNVTLRGDGELHAWIRQDETVLGGYSEGNDLIAPRSRGWSDGYSLSVRGPIEEAVAMAAWVQTTIVEVLEDVMVSVVAAQAAFGVETTTSSQDNTQPAQAILFEMARLIAVDCGLSGLSEKVEMEGNGYPTITIRASRPASKLAPLFSADEKGELRFEFPIAESGATFERAKHLVDAS